jgi:hypothetical protein
MAAIARLSSPDLTGRTVIGVIVRNRVAQLA